MGGGGGVEFFVYVYWTFVKRSFGTVIGRKRFSRKRKKNIEGIKVDSQQIRAISSPNCFPTNQFLFASWYVVYFFGYCKLLRS